MIIVCPKCSRKHRVNPDTLKKYIDSGRNVSATCKVCKYKFPVHLNKLVQPGPVTEDDTEGTTTRKICVTLSKGGVGKTTTSVNLSAGLALAGYKVLLVDTDTQGQSAYMLGKKPVAGLTELLTKELPPKECILSARKNLWLLSGGKSLAGIKRMIDRKSFGAEWALSEALKPLESEYDFIIIDTAPGWDQLIVNVLFYATEVLIPVALEVMSLHGLSEFMRSLGSIQKYRNDVRLKYIVPTFMDARIKGPEKLYSELKKLYPEAMCQPIRYCDSLSEAPSFGKTIFEFAPGSTASSEYRELVKRIAENNDKSIV
ncbi:chromosome partitioning protein [Desulfocicer vacuolatum DSM 3385]|uniref:Chromosome partitioning protein n=1 Tax=Desulfocicer vacuolatum DSM 3385 TaxID=1121400 RepID=A0A1W2E9B9_9BACT|nr:AAA family ATPase [Desulfocicer vacuolatum]SMD06331.1 chromosome partitioning protein [Desulfocicer vacuolatum DSM 3385]